MTDTLVRPSDIAPADLQVKSSAAAIEGGLGVIKTTKDPMEFWIIGGVTGIVDEVNDVVEPGAYAETLTKRKPKIIKDHDWTHRLGKVLEVFEALPGDSRLPKTTARGDAWPAEAGALLAKVRLFDTKEGRDAATRWTEEGVEQEFSIGYIAHKTRKDQRTGTRYIKTLSCFEISDVLWGAMPLAGPLPDGLATKMLAGIAEDEAPAVDAAEVDMFDEAGIDPLDPAADDESHADESPEMEAIGEGLPDEDEDPPEDIEVKYNTGPVGSPGDKENWVDQVGGLPKFIRAIAHALIREGKDESKAIAIAVGTVKRWAAGGGKVSEKTRAKAAKAVAEWEEKKAKAKASKTAAGVLAQIEGGGLRMERDVRIKAYDPKAEQGPEAGSVKPVDDTEAPAGMQPLDETQVAHNGALMPQDEVVESKMFGSCLPGSYEERQRMVQQAAWEALRGEPRQVENGTTKYEWDDVSIVAMWDDRAVVTRYRWDGGQPDTESFEMLYQIRGDHALLGEPEEVRLITTVTVENGGSEEDVALPFADDVQAVAISMKTMLAGMDTKAGRVLSGANESRLRAAVENLIGVLKVAGVDITPPEAPAADTEGSEPAGAPTGTPPVEAKDLKGSGEVIDPSTLPSPEDYLRGLSTFIEAHKPE